MLFGEFHKLTLKDIFLGKLNIDGTVYIKEAVF